MTIEMTRPATVRNAIDPTAYYIQPQASFALVLKLDGQTIPETMRELEAEWPRPEPGPGEILVRVKACALDYLDIFVRVGMPREPAPLRPAPC